MSDKKGSLQRYSSLFTSVTVWELWIKRLSLQSVELDFSPAVHLRSFVETFHSLCPEKPWVTKLSSAGLVYLHFGRQLLAHLTQLERGDRQLEVLYDKVSNKRPPQRRTAEALKVLLHLMIGFTEVKGTGVLTLL